MEKDNIETQMLILESIATRIIDVLNKERPDKDLSKSTCIRILKMYYDTDKDKYDTIVRIIQEKEKMNKKKELEYRIQELKNKMKVCSYGKEELFELESLEKELNKLEME